MYIYILKLNNSVLSVVSVVMKVLNYYETEKHIYLCLEGCGTSGTGICWLASFKQIFSMLISKNILTALTLK